MQSLYQAGAKAMVLVSKADLLSAGEREELAGYAARQLSTQLGLEVPVQLVSVAGADAALCDQWFEQQLEPRLKAGREETAASLQRKAGGLLEAVVKTLEARLEGAPRDAEGPVRQQVTEALRALRNAEASLQAVERGS